MVNRQIMQKNLAVMYLRQIRYIKKVFMLSVAAVQATKSKDPEPGPDISGSAKVVRALAEGGPQLHRQPQNWIGIRKTKKHLETARDRLHLNPNLANHDP